MFIKNQIILKKRFNKTRIALKNFVENENECLEKIRRTTHTH